MTAAKPQHDNHCIMNVDYRPWRIQWVRDNQMEVTSPHGETRVADLSLLNWDNYCRNAAEWLAEESVRLKKAAKYRRELAEQEREQFLREALENYQRLMAHERLLASGYSPIEDLRDEVVLVDLEFTDARPILAVDCQTFHLERLTS